MTLPSTPEIYTLSLHDALPISRNLRRASSANRKTPPRPSRSIRFALRRRSEEHTSELQSLRHLVCRLLLEKKKKKISDKTSKPNKDTSSSKNYRKDKNNI